MLVSLKFAAADRTETMETTSIDLQALLVKCAKSDMAKARKESGIMIAQTKVGTVELNYHAGTRTYSARSSSNGGLSVINHFVDAFAKEASEKLAALYMVQFES